MPRPATSDRTVYQCIDPFAVFRADGVPEVYAIGRQVLGTDPILRTHRHAFADVADVVEAAVARPGERRHVHIPPASAVTEQEPEDG